MTRQKNAPILLPVVENERKKLSEVEDDANNIVKYVLRQMKARIPPSAIKEESDNVMETEDENCFNAARKKAALIPAPVVEEESDTLSEVEEDDDEVSKHAPIKMKVCITTPAI